MKKILQRERDTGNALAVRARAEEARWKLRDARAKDVPRGEVGETRAEVQARLELAAQHGNDAAVEALATRRAEAAERERLRQGRDRSLRELPAEMVKVGHVEPDGFWRVPEPKDLDVKTGVVVRRGARVQGVMRVTKEIETKAQALRSLFDVVAVPLGTFPASASAASLVPVDVVRVRDEGFEVVPLGMSKPASSSGAWLVPAVLRAPPPPSWLVPVAVVRAIEAAGAALALAWIEPLMDLVVEAIRARHAGGRLAPAPAVLSQLRHTLRGFGGLVVVPSYVDSKAVLWLLQHVTTGRGGGRPKAGGSRVSVAAARKALASSEAWAKLTAR